jgi:hypothetical protein
LPEPFPAVVHPLVVDHAVVAPAVVVQDPGFGTKESVQAGFPRYFAVALHKSIRHTHNALHPLLKDTAVSLSN